MKINPMLQGAGGGSSGGYGKPTTLWTNPNPTAAFARQTVTVSQSMSGFKYIGIRFRAITSKTVEHEDVWQAEKFLEAKMTSNNDFIPSFAVSNGASGYYYRFVMSATNTTVEFSNGISGTTSSSSVAIPVEIIGYK